MTVGVLACLCRAVLLSTLPLLFLMYKQTLLRYSGREEAHFSHLFSEAILGHLFWAPLFVRLVFISLTFSGLLIVDRQHDLSYGIFKNFQFYFLAFNNFQD